MRLAARSMSSLLSIFSPERISPSGMFGVMTVESGRSSSMPRPRRGRWRRSRPKRPATPWWMRRKSSPRHFWRRPRSRFRNSRRRRNPARSSSPELPFRSFPCDSSGRDVSCDTPRPEFFRAAHRPRGSSARFRTLSHPLAALSSAVRTASFGSACGLRAPSVRRVIFAVFLSFRARSPRPFRSARDSCGLFRLRARSSRPFRSAHNPCGPAPCVCWLSLCVSGARRPYFGRM